MQLKSAIRSKSINGRIPSTWTVNSGARDKRQIEERLRTGDQGRGRKSEEGRGKTEKDTFFCPVN